MENGAKEMKFYEGKLDSAGRKAWVSQPLKTVAETTFRFQEVKRSHIPHVARRSQLAVTRLCLQLRPLLEQIEPYAWNYLERSVENASPFWRLPFINRYKMAQIILKSKYRVQS